MIVPKIVWPSGGGNELLFAFPPVGVRPFDRAARRHDTIASSGKRQSLLERTDKFLELDLTLVPTEVENYLTRSEEFDHADWIKNQLTVEADTTDVTAPDESNMADKLIPDGGATNTLTYQRSTSMPEIIGRTFTGSVWLRTLSGTASIQIILVRNVSNTLFGPVVDIVVIDTWTRFLVTAVAPSDATLVGLMIGGFNKWTEADGPIYAWGGQLNYGVLNPYSKTQVTVQADIRSWDTFIAAVLGGTNFDYYPDAFAGGNTTYVLEDKVWRPKMQIRGRNRFYDFKLRLREFV